ncbi:hypothetical protein [Microcoleus sp. D3_18_C4]|uniref:hypothetical protein n=1 Tax=Microcoleus sp. D3_18_C4 TaxID=3055335 RepID=UPI002FD46115
MFCKLCKEGSSATSNVRDVTDVTDVSPMAVGSSATSNVRDATDVSPMEEGRRKIEEGMGVNLRSNVVPSYCLTMIVHIP